MMFFFENPQIFDENSVNFLEKFRGFFVILFLEKSVDFFFENLCVEIRGFSFMGCGNFSLRTYFELLSSRSTDSTVAAVFKGNKSPLVYTGQRRDSRPAPLFSNAIFMRLVRRLHRIHVCWSKSPCKCTGRRFGKGSLIVSAERCWVDQVQRC